LLCENNTPLFRNNCQNILIDKINTEKQKNKHIIFFESSNCFVKLKNHFDGDCFHHSKINVLKLSGLADWSTVQSSQLIGYAKEPV
jgi:hypothetical protein